MNPLRLRTALVILLLSAATPQTALAQRACYPVMAGDSAARMAQRITGDPANRFAPWFQLVDHAWVTVPKTHYGSIRSGWLACVDHGQRGVPLRFAAAVPDLQAEAAESRQPLRALQASVDISFLAVAALIVAALSLMRFAANRASERRARARVMRRFGTEFVREFGRPLTQFRGAAPLPRARLRISPRRSQIEVLLAPADGRTYPNLSDHRGNVEYDVARVLSALRRNSFVRGQPYSEGQWVVLPFQFRGRVEQEGFR